MNKNKFFLIALLLIFSLHTVLPQTMPGGQDKVSKPWIFNYNFREALYKTSLLIKSQEISGLLFIKKNDSSLRMVMISELGLKYFDMEFSTINQKNNQVHYMIEFFNRPKIVSAIRASLQLLVLQYSDQALEQAEKDTLSGMTIARLNDENKKYLYYYYLHSGKVEQITINGNLNKKLATFANYDLFSPQIISLTTSKTFWELKKVEK